MERVLVGVQGNSTRSLSASFLAVPGVYARHRCARRSPLSVLVPSPPLLVHPCSGAAVRRQAAAQHRLVSAPPPALLRRSRLRKIGAAGSPTNGPDEIQPYQSN
jgi:hypothetical protein